MQKLEYFTHSCVELIEQIKHLAGQHDQRTHGNRFGHVEGVGRVQVRVGGEGPGNNVLSRYADGKPKVVATRKPGGKEQVADTKPGQGTSKPSTKPSSEAKPSSSVKPDQGTSKPSTKPSSDVKPNTSETPPSNAKWEKMSDDKRDKAMLDSYDEWEKKLTPAQKSALSDYSRYDYMNINDALRKGKMPGKKYNDKVKLATEALNNGSAPFDFSVTRGFNVTGKDGDKIWETFKNGAGKTITDPAFVSTSTDRDAFGGNFQLKIHVPKGSKGGYVANFSQASGEREFILPPGTKFKILSAKEVGKERHVELSVVNG